MQFQTPCPSPPTPLPRGARGEAAFHASLLLLGWATALLLPFHAMLFSGLALIPGDLIDARLVNYLLEHSYQWLLRRPPHLELWSPPVFYPAVNTLAYSDLLISAGPFYWCWRGLGWPPDTAFQLWLLTVASLNFLTMYAFLARVLRCGPLPSAFGAVLFSSANARVAEAGHPQLFVHFFSITALYGLARLFETDAAPPEAMRRRLGPSAWAGVFFGSAVLQLYASYYLGWFIGLGLVIAAVGACARRETRGRLFELLRRRQWVLLGWGLVAILLAAPLAQHYLQAAMTVGVRGWTEVGDKLPTPRSWFLMDASSWLYGWLTPLVAHPGAPGEEQQGVGFLTPALAVWGLWLGRRSSLSGALLWTGAALVVLTTSVGPDGALWYLVYYSVPGAMAVRAVYRVGLILLIAAAVGSASYLQSRKSAWVAAVLALACVLEQGRSAATFSKQESRARVREAAARVPSGCRAFLYSPEDGDASPTEGTIVNVDAMWAGLETGAPTVNGYSGACPPQWYFFTPQIAAPAHRADLAAYLQTWREQNGLAPDVITWLVNHADP